MSRPRALLRQEWGRLEGTAGGRTGHSSSAWDRTVSLHSTPCCGPDSLGLGLHRGLHCRVALHLQAPARTPYPPGQCQSLGSEPLAGQRLGGGGEVLGPSAWGATEYGGLRATDKNSEPNSKTWREGRCGTCCAEPPAGLESA